MATRRLRGASSAQRVVDSVLGGQSPQVNEEHEIEGSKSQGLPRLVGRGD